MFKIIEAFYKPVLFVCYYYVATTSYSNCIFVAAQSLRISLLKRDLHFVFVDTLSCSEKSWCCLCGNSCCYRATAKLDRFNLCMSFACGRVPNISYRIGGTVCD